MKSIFALALGLTLMASPSFAQSSARIDTSSNVAVPTPADLGRSPPASPEGRDSGRVPDDIKEAPLSQGSLAALMIMAALAGLLVVQRQRS